jgi:hypothetical protein
VLALAAAADFALLAGGLAIVVLIFALGAVRSSGIVASRPIAWLAVAVGLVSLSWTYIDESPDLGPMVAVLGVSFVVAIMIQLGRRDGRPALTLSLAASVSACVLAALPVLWLAMYSVNEVGSSAVELGLLGVGMVALLESVPISRAIRRVLGVLLSAAIASALGAMISDLSDSVPPVSAVVVTAIAGLITAVAYAITDRIGDEVPSAPDPVEVTVPDLATSSAASSGEVAPAPVGGTNISALAPMRISLPFIAAAPVVYILGRLLVELPS